MAYQTGYLAVDNIGGLNNAQVWTYHTADSAATIGGAGYISDAVARGMQLGDIVIVVQSATVPNGAATGVSVYAVSAISAGAATIIKTATA